MSRPLRTVFAGGAYHVFARGNAKQEIFSDDRDHHIFLDVASDAILRFSWQCLAYCLMPNHYHLVVKTSGADLSRGMRQINGVYAQRFNRRHDRVGHLFQGRFGATLIQADEHLLEAIRYVVQNPVRAGLVERIEQWPWTSQRELLGHSATKLLSTSALLCFFDPSREKAIERYLEFMSADPALELGSGPILGDEAFEAKHLPERPPSPEIPRGVWQTKRPRLTVLLDASDLDRAIASAYRIHGYTMREIAESLGCHYATVSRRLRKFESREACKRGMLDCKT
jgi:REP-associated tyrosine transposase